MLASVIAAFVYLRIVLAMYAPSDEDEQLAPTSRALVDAGTRAALSLSAVAVLFLGIAPWGMLDFAKHATQLITH
jgi:NADH:ubiquinone oxidoreductase subunit 2 (subunit N)